MSAFTPKISFSAGISSDHITGLVRSTLESICLAAGVQEIWITSAYRDAEGQAAAMYDNLEQGKPASGNAAQRQITKVYKQQLADGETNAETIKSAMADKITAIGPEKVSKHAKRPDYIVVVDVSLNRMPQSRRPWFVEATRAKIGLWVVGFGHPFARKGKEFFDPVFHLELLTELGQSGVIDLAEQQRTTA